ncbi:hypothetical protein [Candidatus Binatus sp.]|uniref:hypothetical protein n=1 Tax=Candidatus Binatus sp. TaxID=2811406 RepID=UPI003BD1295A
MDLTIIAPEQFNNAADLDSRAASKDPRKTSFEPKQLDIDLRGCEFIRPAAVLWCLIYGLLSVTRSEESRLLLPDNLGVALYLKSVGLLGVLGDSGFILDDQGISGTPDPGERLVLPIKSLGSESDVDTVANQVLERLQDSNIGAANLYPVVSEVFAELALNAVQHSDSSIAAFGLIQFYQSETGRRFICAVADGGIGIRASLERNPALRRRAPYEWTAIDLALEEGVSGTGSPSRGIGLFGVADEMTKPGRQLIIHSGNGLLLAGGNSPNTRATRCAVPFPGTLTLASIPA